MKKTRWGICSLLLAAWIISLSAITGLAAESKTADPAKAEKVIAENEI